MKKEEYLKQIDEVIEKGPYKDTWESLCRHTTPRWYSDAKFGIFIHWGVYSVPGYGSEWYPRNVYRKGSKENVFHTKKYGPLNKFGYKDFIPMFKAEKFDPDSWSELFKKAGAKFVMPVAEHHDGFQMYDSDLCKWNSKNMGPKRDIVGELKEAVEKNGMKLCTSSHRAEHWWFYNHGRNIDCDVNDDTFRDFYGPSHGVTNNHGSLYNNQPDQEFLEDWLIRTCEIVDKYHTGIMFFDWWIQVSAFKPYLKKFAAYYYNRAVEWDEEVAIDAKFDAYVHGSCTKDIERGQMASIQPDLWQNDTSVAKNSWGYTIGNDYKTSTSIICDLVDVVSKNGALLLNVGPKPDGTIPDEDAKILTEIGQWMDVNGEAIYNTSYWKTFGEGPTAIPEGMMTDTEREPFTSEDIRFTSKANHIYAIAMKWNESGNLKIKSLRDHGPYLKSCVRDVEILGDEIHPDFEQRDGSLEIYSDHKMIDDKPVVVKITID
jgi:alpha-L-fucosidase